MAQYNTLKTAIQDVVKTNGNNEITGALLQQSLIAIINSLGSGYQFFGVATPTTNPGTPDEKGFYLARCGTYQYFGNTTIPVGCFGIFIYATSWVYREIGMDFYRDNLRAYLSAANIISNSSSLTYVIPVVPGQLLHVVSGSETMRVAVVNTYSTSGSIDYATGCSLASGNEYTKLIPSDGHFVLVVINAAGTIRTPERVEIDGTDVMSDVQLQIEKLSARITVLGDQINVVAGDVPAVTRSANLLDPDGIIEGVILDTGGGGTHENVDYNTSDWMAITGGHTYKSNRLIRRVNWYSALKGYISQNNSISAGGSMTAPANAVYARISFAATTVLPIRFGDSTTEWDVPYGVQRIDIGGARVALYSDISQQDLEVFRGKNLAIIGDSATTPTQWPQRLGIALGVDRCDLYGVGGYTWRNRYSGGTLSSCIGVLINNMVASGYNYDIILFQIGGNDISDDAAELGTVDAAFDNYNYKAYKDATDSASCVRYYLEYVRRTYPKALIIVGTVFQRIGTKNGTSAKSINDILRDSCKRLAIQMIDGENDMGFSGFLEPVSPYYNDGNPGIADDRTNLSRSNPAYNYIETATGNIVNYATATDNGTLRPGYEKRYGLYTYDSKHQNLRGENKVLDFMIANLRKLYKSDNLQKMT